jgi:hypothetical protein
MSNMKIKNDLHTVHKKQDIESRLSIVIEYRFNIDRVQTQYR